MGKGRGMKPEQLAACTGECRCTHVVHFPFSDDPLYFRSDRIPNGVIRFLSLIVFSVRDIDQSVMKEVGMKVKASYTCGDSRTSLKIGHLFSCIQKHVCLSILDPV